MIESSIIDEKDRQARVSSLLHGAEASIKKNELEDALEKVRSVYTIDLKNLYAHAFEERILEMILARSNASKPDAENPPSVTSAKETRNASSGAFQQQPGTESRKFEPERQETANHTPAPALPEESMLELHESGIRAHPTPGIISRPVIDSKPMGHHDSQRSEFLAERSKWEEERAFIIERERLRTKEHLLEAYKAFVMLMDVSIPKDQLETLLLSLRGILDVSEQEHAEIIRSVQINAYTDTLRSMWQKGSLTEEEEGLLAQMRTLYGISAEEHHRLERQIKQRLGFHDRSGGILAIDDSKDILIFIEYVLKKKYANVRTAGSVQEAVDAIRKEIPAMILCDVMMPETGGFAFYDMIRKGEFGEALKAVPFVFMSVCSDEYMKNIADTLGVQQYLSKPFSREILERTVREILGS